MESYACSAYFLEDIALRHFFPSVSATKIHLCDALSVVRSFLWLSSIPLFECIVMPPIPLSYTYLC